MMSRTARSPTRIPAWRTRTRLFGVGAACAATLLAASGSPSLAFQTGGAGNADLPRFVADVYGFEVRHADGTLYDHPFLGGFNLPRPQLADIDGDGDDDLFVQEYSGRVMHFERVDDGAGGWRYVWRSDAFQELDVGEWYLFVDVDDDGDLDLLGEERFSLLRFFRNESADRAPRLTLHTERVLDVGGEPVFSDRQNIPKVADLDCDNQLDLLVGRVEGTITRYEIARFDERGAPVFRHVEDRFQDIEIIGQVLGMPPARQQQRRPGPSLTLHGANTMAFEDFDGDGDLDLFWGDFFEPGVLLIENRGACRTPSLRSEPRPFPLQEPVETSGYNAPAFGDVDGDGDADMLVGVLGGAFNPNNTTIDNLLWFDNVGQRRYEERTRRFVRQIDVGAESVPALVDIDGDGDLELFVGNRIEPGDTRAGRLYRFDNTGTAAAPALRLRGAVEPFDQAYHYAPSFGDLDADGDIDMLLGSWDDELSLVINEGDPTHAVWRVADPAVAKLTRGRNAVPALGDLDGDGDLDLLVGESSGELNRYRNVGSSTAPRFELIDDKYLGIDVGRRSAPALVDLDGDGDLDLVMGSEAEGLVLFRNRGTVSEARFELDADADLPRANPFSTPAFGDLDGDGDLDLITGGIGGGVQFFRNVGR